MKSTSDISKEDFETTLQELRALEQNQAFARSELKKIKNSDEIPIIVKKIAIKILEISISKTRRSPGGLRDLNKIVYNYYHNSSKKPLK